MLMITWYNRIVGTIDPGHTAGLFSRMSWLHRVRVEMSCLVKQTNIRGAWFRRRRQSPGQNKPDGTAGTAVAHGWRLCGFQAIGGS